MLLVGHASPAALELGVTLEPGETIVQVHEQGSESLGRVTAYKLIRRPEE
jgi:hypothetical protein